MEKLICENQDINIVEEWNEISLQGMGKEQERKRQKKLNERYKNPFRLTNQRQNGGVASAFS